MSLEMTPNHESYFPVKWGDSNSEEEEDDDIDDEEEEETLSFCDLPLNLISEETQQQHPKKQAHQSTDPQHDDFDFDFDFCFGSNMCAADDVFFRGKILPLRRPDPTVKLPPRTPTRILSRSESVDSGSFSSASGTSSRSSSTRSVNSSNGSSAIPITRASNPFHTYPSPQPQIPIPTGRARSFDGTRRRKSTTLWDTFRLGLVRTPEIEFQDLRLRRNNNSHSWSSSKCSNSSNPRNPNHPNHEINRGRRRRSFDYGFWSGCKCSIKAVEIPAKKKSNSVGRRINIKSGVAEEEEGKEEEEEEEEKKAGRLMTRHLTRRRTRHRTFEWVKELSHAVGSYHSLSL